jgi:hypothetical protein
MQRSAHLAWFFRVIYMAPPCGYIAGGIVVRIGSIATIFTTKAFPVSIPNMVAIRTHPGCLGKRYGKELSTTQSDFIGQVLPQQIKTPAVQFCLLSLISWLSASTDIAQVFDGNSLVFCLCLCYNPFCYNMVIDGNKPAFPAPEPFHIGDIHLSDQIRLTVILVKLANNGASGDFVPA